MRIIAASLMLVCSAWLASAQETPVVGNLNEQRVPLNQPAVALDGTGVQLGNDGGNLILRDDHDATIDSVVYSNADAKPDNRYVRFRR